MRNLRTWSAGAALLLLVIAGPAQAEGWSWNDVNPFSKLPMPKHKISWPSPPAMRAPAPVRKFGRDTKRFFTSTWKTVTFQEDKSSASSASGSLWQRGSKRAQLRQAEQKKSSWLGSLFKTEAPKPIRTANDFLKLSRPQP